MVNKQLSPSLATNKPIKKHRTWPYHGNSQDYKQKKPAPRKTLEWNLDYSVKILLPYVSDVFIMIVIDRLWGGINYKKKTNQIFPNKRPYTNQMLPLLSISYRKNCDAT